MRRHTGGTLSLDRGVVYGTATRRKLNTFSLTEAELVTIDDCTGQILLTHYFLEPQGYQVDDTIVYQDSQTGCCWKTNVGVPA